MLHVCIFVKCSEQTKNQISQLGFSQHYFLYSPSKLQEMLFLSMWIPVRYQNWALPALQKKKSSLNATGNFYLKYLFKICFGTRALLYIISDTKLHILAQSCCAKNHCVLALYPKKIDYSYFKWTWKIKQRWDSILRILWFVCTHCLFTSQNFVNCIDLLNAM